MRALEITPERVRAFCEEVLGIRLTPTQYNLLWWLTAPVGKRVKVSGLTKVPKTTHAQCLLLGRCSGKSTIAVIRCLLQAVVNPGTQILLASPSLTQSGDVLMKYARDFCLNSSLREYVIPRTTEALCEGSKLSKIRLRNGSEIFYSSNKSSNVRGYGPATVVLDEVAVWPLVSGEGKDIESFLQSIRPRMCAEYPADWRIIMLTTPQQASGWLWEAVQRPPEDFAFVKASTLQVRPDIDKSQFKGLRDSEYRREILCEFASSEDSPLPLELLDGCETSPDHIPVPQGRTVIACDAGFRADFSGFTVVSKHEEMYFVHTLRRAKMKGCVGAFIDTIRVLKGRYPQGRVILDQFSGDALKELLSREGISATVCPWHQRNRDGIFEYVRMLFEDRKIVLPHNRTLREEIAGLKVRWSPSGRRRVDHGAGHDDLLFSLLLGVERLRTRNEVRLLT